MGVLADWQIKQQVKIEPFADEATRPGVVSYGLSSYGYDCRLGYKFKVFSNAHCAIVDPKAFDPNTFVDKDLTPRPHSILERTFRDGANRRIDTDEYYCSACKAIYLNHEAATEAEAATCPVRSPSNQLLVPPNSFVLGESLETFKIPRDCLAVCLGKSTYARCGIIVNVTPLEPEWEGKVTIEVSNTTPLPAAIYAGEGIMQVLFLRSDGFRAYHVAAFYQLLKSMNGEDAPDPKKIMETFHRPYEEQSSSCRISYADKKGRYQRQSGLTTPFVSEEEKP